MATLRRNTIWSLAGSAVPLPAAFFAIPYLLDRFGADGFGVLTLVWALIGYFSLFDFGVGRALTVELGKRRDAPLPDQAAVLRAGLRLVLLTGLAGAALMLLVAAPLTTTFLKISPAWAAEARSAFQITAVGVLATTLASGLRGAMEGLNLFRAANVNRLVMGLLQFALPCLAVVIHGPSLFHACLYLVVARYALALAALVPLRALLAIKGSMIERAHYLSLINFGAWATVTGIVGPLMIYGDRFFVSAAVGAAVLVYYAVPQEGLQRLLMLPGALCAALLASLSGASAVEALHAYHRNLRQVAMWHGLVCAAAAILAYPVFLVWLSREFAVEAIGVTLVLSLGIWLNGIALVPYTLLHSQVSPKLTALFHIAELGLYIGALAWLTSRYGIVGAAWAWTLRAGLDLVLLLVTSHRWATASVGRSGIAQGNSS